MNNDEIVRLRIRSDGQDLPDGVPVIRCTVHHAVHGLPWAKLVVADGDVAANESPISDGPLFRPGAAIEIFAGYGDEDSLLFSGMVVRHGYKITGNNFSRLVIDCQDMAFKMAQGHESATHAEQTDSAGLDAAPVLTIQWGVNLLELDAHVDAHVEALSQQTTEQAPVRGRMRFGGHAAALPGTRVRLEGVGKRFNGDRFISAVQHDIAEGEWLTEAELGLDPRWHVEPSGLPASLA